MRVYSDKLNKPFDTEEECIKAEKEFDKEQKRIKEELDKAIAARRAEDEKLNTSKKEMSKIIEEADKKLAEANSVYKVARQKASEIIDEAKQKANEILSAAREKVTLAQEEKYKAVSAFNAKFGPYTISLTSEQAAEEFNKAITEFNNLNSLFSRNSLLNDLLNYLRI